MQICLVGGAVRDQLLGLTGSDRDWVVVGATPQEMIDSGYEQVGKDFPVFLHPQTKEEYALARIERKSGQGYYGFVCDSRQTVSLVDDLRRRDLTINAMALCDGELVDPYGGQQDIQLKQLRHVSDAFAEDPLRVLRVARFHARFAPLGFQVAEETLTLMTDMVASGELEALTAERVWLETTKALLTAQPSVYFQTLRRVGALAVWMPELDHLFSVPQDEKHHPEGDAGTHTLMMLDVLRQKTDDISLLWAAVCHDLGKGITPIEHWPKHPQHEQQGVPLVKQLNQRLRIGKQAQRLSELACRWHGEIHKGAGLTASERLAVLDACDVWRKPETLTQLLLLCEADSQGRQGFADAAYPVKKIWSKWLAELQGLDVQSIVNGVDNKQQIPSEIRRARLEILAKMH